MHLPVCYGMFQESTLLPKHLERPEVPPRPLNPFGQAPPPRPDRPPTAPVRTSIPPPPPPPPSAPLPPGPPPPPPVEEQGEAASVALFNEINSKGLDISQGIHFHFACFAVVYLLHINLHYDS